MEFFLESGLDLTLALQNAGDWIVSVMKGFTFLGTEDFYIVFLVLVWAFDYSLSMRLGVMLMLTTALNSFFKMAFHQPRPYWSDSKVLDLGGPELGFGVPSGHSQTPVSLFGLFATTLKEKWMKIAVWVVIFFIDISRMILGVHYYLDVLVGWTIGLIILWLFMKFEPNIKEYFSKKQIGTKILLVFLVSIVLLSINFGIRAINGDFTLDPTWIANAASAHPEEMLDPFSMDGSITTAATLFGLSVGYFWISSIGTYQVKKNLGVNFLVFIIGLIGVLAIKQGLGAVFPGEDNLAGYFFRYLRYTIIGFWIMGLGPWLLVKLKLAKLD